MTSADNHRFIFFLLLLITMVIGTVTALSYGITWDEPENFFVGRVYLNVLSQGSMRFLKDPDHLAIPQALPFRSETHWERYAPFPLLVSSLSSLVLSETFHLTHPVTAHHLGVVFFGALGVAATYALALELTGSVAAGVMSALILFLVPLYFGQMHNNIKDIPYAAMAVLSVFLWLRAGKNPTSARAVAAGISFGLTLATRVTGVLLVPAFVLWVVAFARKQFRMSFRNIALGIAVSFATLCAVWPWLIAAPISHTQLIWQYLHEVGRGLPVLFDGQRFAAGVSVPWYYAAVMVFLTIPLPVAGAFVAGLSGGFGKKGAPMAIPAIVIGTFLLPYLLPSTIIYNGARHLMAVYPFIAVIAGWGSVVIVRRVRRMPRLAAVAVLILLLGSEGLAIVRFYPFETVYFNPVAGSMKRAAVSYDFDYWGFSVADMVRYLNVTPGMAVGPVYVEWIGFRGEYFSGNRFPFTEAGSGNARYVIVPNSRNFFDGAITYWQEHGTLIYTPMREGVPIGYLYRTDRGL